MCNGVVSTALLDIVEHRVREEGGAQGEGGGWSTG